MSFYDMSWLTDAEGIDDAIEIQLDLMSPFNIFDMVKDPSLETLIKSAYMPTMAYLGYYGASALVGEAAPGFWVRRALSYEATKGALQAGVRFVPTAAIVSVPITISVVGAIGYERTVNRAVRRSTPGSRGHWFGPFASGFGPVV